MRNIAAVRPVEPSTPKGGARHAQRKDSPNTPSKGGSPKSAGGNSRSSGKGGGKSAAGGADVGEVRNTTARREKASPSGRDRGERSSADRA